LDLSYKEGLALINGTQIITAIGALCWHDSIKLMKYAQIALALALEGLGSVDFPFQERIHKLRPFAGQAVIAKNIRKLLDDSQIIAKNLLGKVQDAYSLRCAPQVLGPVLDTLAYIRKQLEIEMNSVVDNPIIFPDDKDAIGAGNFHAEGQAFVVDFMAIVISEVANLAERHINRMVNPAISNGLPAFLVESEGLNSGMMLAQYTAAALVSENKTLSHPCSVDSIPVSADQEDHVSMGANAANKLLTILENVFNVISVELLCAAQAIDFRRPLKSARGTEIAYQTIRKAVSFWDKDRVMYEDIHAVRDLLRSDELILAVEEEVGEIEIV
jgi:histidine ammonia-lyase